MKIRQEVLKMGIVGAVMVPHPPLIIPEVGRGGEKQIQKTTDAYNEAGKLVARLNPETIVVCSPHTVMYYDYFHISPGKKAKGSFARFRAGNVKIQTDYDTEFVSHLCDMADAEEFPAGTLGERDAQLDHATMIPLYFIQKYYTDFKTVRVGLSGLPFAQHYRLGMMIQKAAQDLDRRVVFVGSGDLSHKTRDYGPYGFVEEGPEYDQKIMDSMGRAAFGELLEFDENFCERAAECGHRSFVMLGGSLDGLSVSASRLSLEEVTGVGYGVCTYEVTGRDESRHFLAQYEEKQKARLAVQVKEQDPYVALARLTIDKYIRSHVKVRLFGTEAGGLELPKEMLENRAGAFVSIHEDGRLRGCIGTISPCTDCVAQEIIDNAISAATRDPRFHAIRKRELLRLEISVDVLGKPENISSKDQLDVHRYGVIVTSEDGRRGLLLPDLDGVDTVEEQISIAREKAGIGRSEEVKLQRFEVVRHH